MTETIEIIKKVMHFDGFFVIPVTRTCVSRRGRVSIKYNTRAHVHA